MSFGRLQPRNVLHHAAVGDDRRGRQVTRPVSGEEGDDARDLFRSRRIQFGKRRGVLHCGEVNRRSDRARGNADDQDIVRSEFHTGGARQNPHSTLGKATRGVAGHRPILVDRGKVDDAGRLRLASASAWLQAGAEEGALQVDLQYLSRIALRWCRESMCGFRRRRCSP